DRGKYGAERLVRIEGAQTSRPSLGVDQLLVDLGGADTVVDGLGPAVDHLHRHLAVDLRQTEPGGDIGNEARPTLGHVAEVVGAPRLEMQGEEAVGGARKSEPEARAEAHPIEQEAIVGEHDTHGPGVQPARYRAAAARVGRAVVRLAAVKAGELAALGLASVYRARDRREVGAKVQAEPVELRGARPLDAQPRLAHALAVAIGVFDADVGRLADTIAAAHAEVTVAARLAAGVLGGSGGAA